MRIPQRAGAAASFVRPARRFSVGRDGAAGSAACASSGAGLADACVGAPDRVQTVKQHRWVERWSLGMGPCADLSRYLEQAFAWPGAQWRRWIERTRWRAGREATRQPMWIASAACPWSLTLDGALARLQAHWTIENHPPDPPARGGVWGGA